MSPSGHVIQLHRPAFRNNGMDFTVRCPTIRFNPGNRLIRHMPRHRDLESGFKSLRRKYGAEYDVVKQAIWAAYNCKRIKNLKILANMLPSPLDGGDRCPGGVLIFSTKWIFVEQDVTYWHNSGRAMFFKGLQAAALV